MQLDRHRLQQLIALSGLEQTLTGPERMLRQDEVSDFLKTAFTDATERARADFVSRMRDQADFPWSAVRATRARGGGGASFALPVAVLAPPALVLLRGQAETIEADPGNRLPDRGSAGAAEWEFLHRALDAWDTQTILRAVGPVGWINPSQEYVPWDTDGGATSGAPAGAARPAPDAPSPAPGDGGVPAPATPPRPRVYTYLAATAGIGAAVGVTVLVLRRSRENARQRLADALRAQEKRG